MTEEAITQNVPPAEAPPVAAADSDPFSLDEKTLGLFSPEQRASLSPILDGWKSKAKDEISKRESELEKYKSYGEKATALDKLTQYAPFVQWWQQQQQEAQSQASGAGQAQAIGKSKPADIATQVEWQDAIYQASQGNGEKLSELQSRMMTAWASPYVAQLKAKQDTLDAKLELRSLFEDHPDAKELDMIGIDPKSKEGVSLLETGLDWAERNGKTMVEGYEFSKKLADSIRMSAQQQAMGLVAGKKESVTQGPSTTKSGGNLVEVSTVDELLKKSMDAQMSGNKDVSYVLRK